MYKLSENAPGQTGPGYSWLTVVCSDWSELQQLLIKSTSIYIMKRFCTGSQLVTTGLQEWLYMCVVRH